MYHSSAPFFGRNIYTGLRPSQEQAVKVPRIIRIEETEAELIFDDRRCWGTRERSTGLFSLQGGARLDVMSIEVPPGPRDQTLAV